MREEGVIKILDDLLFQMIESERQPGEFDLSIVPKYRDPESC